MIRFRAWAARGFACALLVGCLDDVEVGQTSTASGGAERVDAAYECVPTRCGGPLLECGDCIDNDEDGLVDHLDPDCFGPCSDTEAALLGRPQPCDTGACFFDFDCGGGNDQRCANLVPNGCDCHGCCQVGDLAVALGSVGAAGEPSCTADTLTDPDACQPCTQDPACTNACDECESCFDDRLADDPCARPPGCAEPACPDGVEPCSPQCGIPCPAALVCITGCCVDPS